MPKGDDKAKRNPSEEELLRGIYDASYDAIFVLDPIADRVIDANPAAVELLGYSQQELRHIRASAIHPHEMDRLRAITSETLETGAAVQTDELTCLTMEGRHIPVEISFARLYCGGNPALLAVVHDITARKQAEKELRESEALVRSILNTAVDGIITINDRGIVESFNMGAEQMFGYRPDEVIGNNVSVLMPPSESENHDRHLERYLRTGERKIIGIGRDVVGQRKDGTTFPMHLAVSEVRHGDRRIFTGIAHDMTERCQLEERLRERAEELNRSNRDLSDFTHVVSHDLQEPLRKITSFGDFLMEDCADRLDEAGIRYVRRMQKAAGRMKQLIRNLLQLAEAGSHGIDLRMVNTQDVVQEVLNTLQLTIADAGAEISVGSLPSVRADRTQIAQVFQNLIDNAIKFRGQATSHQTEPHASPSTRDAGPSIRITATIDEDWVTFSVRDNGIGIEPRFHHAIFRSFQRLHPKEAYGGTGLGLALCRKIVERHGSRIWCESELGHGATFYFTVRKT